MRITHEQIDQIVSEFEHLNLDELSSTLPLNPESLKARFNGRIVPFLDKAPLDEEERDLMNQLLLIDDYQLQSNEGLDFFFNIFGDTIGFFGMGATGDNFKILRMCFTLPDNKREAQTLDFVFDAFAKCFLPDVDSVEFINALKENRTVTRDGVQFSLTQKDNLLTVTAVGE